MALGAGKSRKILLTGIGDGGSNNLVFDMTRCGLTGGMPHHKIIGSNCDLWALAKSPVMENSFLPRGDSPDYIEAMEKLVKEKEIDLIIPNNDTEVKALGITDSEIIRPRVFLPNERAIQMAQNKFAFYELLVGRGLPIPQTAQIHDGFLDEYMGAFWIRPKKGSGSRGATRVESYNDAVAWIDVWYRAGHYGHDFRDWMISEYIEGKDWCVSSLWHEGYLISLKMVERIEYVAGASRHSGRSSSPSVAKTVFNHAIAEACEKAARALMPKPHGMFNFDLVGRNDEEFYFTECNIGRFCMIAPIFNQPCIQDRSPINLYVKMFFDTEFAPKLLAKAKGNPYEYWPDQVLLRGLDQPFRIVHEEDIKRMWEHAALHDD